MDYNSLDWVSLHYKKNATYFSEAAASQLIDFYRKTSIFESGNHRVLDLCCGCGNLARKFWKSGFSVTGVDISEKMLQVAKEDSKGTNCTFLRGDATTFVLENLEFGLVCCTFNAINHIAPFEAVRGLFRNAYAHLAENGVFVFDFNTAAYLRHLWNASVTKFLSDGAYCRILRFDEAAQVAYSEADIYFSLPNGEARRVQERIMNHAYSMVAIKQALELENFKEVHFSSSYSFDSLDTIDETYSNGPTFCWCKK